MFFQGKWKIPLTSAKDPIQQHLPDNLEKRKAVAKHGASAHVGLGALQLQNKKKLAAGG